MSYMWEPDRGMIIGVVGYAQAGKDSIGKILVEDFGFERIGLADKLREAALALDPLIAMEFGPTEMMRMPVLTPTEDMFQNPRGDTIRLFRLSEVVRERGWEEAKKIPEVRRTLQRFGTEAGRETLGPDVWVDAALDQMRMGQDYVIPDVRFLNEADAIHHQRGMVWRVTRPGVGPLNDHPSEREQERIEVDYEIANDGTLGDLRKKVHEAVTETKETV